VISFLSPLASLSQIQGPGAGSGTETIAPLLDIA
jgi:hypothetical protein